MAGAVARQLGTMRMMWQRKLRLVRGRREADRIRRMPPPMTDEEDGAGKGQMTTLQMGAVMAVIALGAKLIMMYDETQEPARTAQRAREFAEAQEGMKPFSKEEWDHIQQIHPLTPFDASVDTSRARVRTGHWPGWGDVSSWAADSISDAIKRTP